jgi:hypothetical protein
MLRSIFSKVPVLIFGKPNDCEPEILYRINHLGELVHAHRLGDEAVGSQIITFNAVCRHFL